MRLTFEEACSAAADLYEAAPELWTRGMLGRNAYGVGVYPLDNDAEKWCAGGMVMAAMGGNDGLVFAKLTPYGRALGFYDAIDANNIGGRLVAIKMLRMASGELK